MRALYEVHHNHASIGGLEERYAHYQSGEALHEGHGEHDDAPANHDEGD